MVGIRQTIMEDLYLILENVNDLGGAFENEAQAQRATFEIQVNVMVEWIWYGGFIVYPGIHHRTLALSRLDHHHGFAPADWRQTARSGRTELMTWG